MIISFKKWKDLISENHNTFYHVVIFISLCFFTKFAFKKNLTNRGEVLIPVNNIQELRDVLEDDVGLKFKFLIKGCKSCRKVVFFVTQKFNIKKIVKIFNLIQYYGHIFVHFSISLNLILLEYIPSVLHWFQEPGTPSWMSWFYQHNWTPVGRQSNSWQRQKMLWMQQWKEVLSRWY